MARVSCRVRLVSCRVPPASCSMLRCAASLAALALLLRSATAAATELTDGNYCALLAEKNFNRTETLGWRSVSVEGRAVSVSLVWGSEPAHAAAALLAVLLRHVRRYRGVRLPRHPHPHDIAELAANVTYVSSGLYTDLVIGVSTAWEPKLMQSWNLTKGPSPGLAGPRLAEFGVSPVPTRSRLFAWLAPHARSLPACRRRVRWAFYANQTVFADCDFVGAVNAQGPAPALEVLVVGDCAGAPRQLAALRPRRVRRAHFLRTLRSANRSLLFLDYDMWEGAPNVSVVELPPCERADDDCTQQLDAAVAIRVADVDTLLASAPMLFQFVYDFKPSPETLRLILERQASGVDIEEAACQWALEHKAYDVADGDRVKYDLYKYIVATYLCEGDPSNYLYDKIIALFGAIIYNKTSVVGCDIQLRRYYINCSDSHNMSYRLDDFTRKRGFYSLVGAVSMVGQGAAEASVSSAASRVPLMLAGAAPERATAARATWRVAGRARHVACATRHFVRASGWARVAVLSQPTELAADYSAALKDQAEIILGEFPINRTSDFTEQQAREVLKNLRASNVRIVFVNADSQAAHTLLATAAAAGMGYADGFVWIVRDWLPSAAPCATQHFTVSFWDRGLDVPAKAAGEAARLRRQLNGVARPWPPRAASLANALLTLSIGFKDVFARFPDTRQDLHSAQMLRALQESLIETPVTGISQTLRYKERSLEETFVFVDQWCGSAFQRRLATWRVNASSGVVRGQHEARAGYSPPADLPRDDGASRCAVHSADKFQPTCYDAWCACALLLLALAPGAALLARRALRRHLARLQQEQQIQAIARRRHVATVLAAYLVERTALELHEELGAGRFGSVRLARLREPGRAPRYIAAKALRSNAAPAEESEFLREACTIASLSHAHIVRLVGVCIADGPPLVLMELAFFGDLLGYLRTRRHLVEGAGSETPAESGEVEHVSAEALTRLAREAAEALQYLGVRGVVHRDVRAANCLVDVRRSLKLADFGMARDTVAGADGAPEYSCRRRALFPVLWMAPESLAHGVFSAASDVWALGVLVLELVTLGGRPYGTMSPLRVLEYVARGGFPPLPLDATPQTRGLARLCWARAAERRPSAAEVAAYLAAWPLALRPALLSERDEPADADSGFGESPSTELLPADSPLHSLDQLEDLAATH